MRIPLYETIFFATLAFAVAADTEDASADSAGE